MRLCTRGTEAGLDVPVRQMKLNRQQCRRMENKVYF